ncbi:MAG: sugar ABC transporter ATP-binding protein [Chloroflexota bacterium]|nr:sugar ABC transporter ATP-binding protein [Chloroflexota bacterium]
MQNRAPMAVKYLPDVPAHGTITSNAAEERPILRMTGITKRFPGVVALDHVDFSVRAGEIHSLIGQNGAGKSTLMNILSGVYSPDEGEISVDGRPVTISRPSEALRLGIGTVYQELSLVPRLSVADNIYLGRETERGFVINERRVVGRAREVLARLGVTDINVGGPLGELSLAQQQLVEIAKVLSYNPRILVLDEPTAPLVQEDTDRLFRLLDGLKKSGIAIVFISHRFREIIEHCDRGTILRNGKLIKTVSLQGVTEEALAETMIGQQLESFYRHSAHSEGPEAEPALEVEGLSVGRKVRGVSFTLRRGEIAGMTGLLGAGQNEVARALFGVQSEVSGVIRRNGRPVSLISPGEAIKHGICLLTENRKREGLFLDMSVKENMTLPSMRSFNRAGVFVDNGKERQWARRFIDRMNIVVRSASSRVRTLSGGNQQKSILARWLMRDLDVLIFIEPTRGIDVGAKAEIYAGLDRLAKDGKSILVVSTELPEVLGISDRVMVMYNGHLSRVFERSEASEEALLAAIQGDADACR